jgi:hypothetical protein
MGPSQLNLTAYTDAGLYEVVEIVTTANVAQDLTGWTVHAGAVDSLLDVAEALTMTAQVVSVTAGTISISVTAAAAAALFVAGDNRESRTLQWTLLAKPYGTYTVKLFSGTLTVIRGAGRWV